MKIKIFCKELERNKPFFVETSNRNVRAATEMQLAQAEMADENKTNKAGTKDFDVVKKLKSSLNFLDKVEKFIMTTLHLDPKQKERLERMDSDETTMLAIRITMRLQGMSDKEVDEAFSDDDGDDSGEE